MYFCYNLSFCLSNINYVAVTTKISCRRLNNIKAEFDLYYGMYQTSQNTTFRIKGYSYIMDASNNIVIGVLYG